MDRVNTAIAISFGLGDAAQDAAARAEMQEDHLRFTASLGDRGPMGYT